MLYRPRFPYLGIPRREHFTPVSLDAEDTLLFLTLARDATYRTRALDGLRRRGYVRGHPFLPAGRVARAYRALATTVCSWTLEVRTPHGRRDTAVCFGRRRTAVIDVAEDGTSVLSMVPLRGVPALIADRVGLGPRGLLSGDEVRLAHRPDRVEAWGGVVEATRNSWSEVATDLRDGRWVAWTLTRTWVYDGLDPASGFDVWTVLDTPSGMLRFEPDDRGEGGLLRPIPPTQVWAHLGDGPDVTDLALTVLEMFWPWKSRPGTATRLLDLRASARP